MASTTCMCYKSHLSFQGQLTGLVEQNFFFEICRIPRQVQMGMSGQQVQLCDNKSDISLLLHVVFF